MPIWNAKCDCWEFWMAESGKDSFVTMFPNDPNEMPQDVPTYEQAKRYGDEYFGTGNYTIESPCG